MDHRLHRSARVVRAGLAAVLLVALTACSDREAYPHAGQSGGWAEGSAVRTVLLFLLAPLALWAIISLLAWLPGAARRYRYRPQEGWNAEPVWFAGPPEPVRAVEQAATGDVVRGGAGGSW